VSTRTPADRLSRLVTRAAVCAALITGGIALLTAAAHAAPAMVLVGDPGGEGSPGASTPPAEPDEGSTPRPTPGRTTPTRPPGSGLATAPAGHAVAPKVAPATVPAPHAAGVRPATNAPAAGADAAPLSPASSAPGSLAPNADTQPNEAVTTTVTPVRPTAGTAPPSGGGSFATLAAVTGSLALLALALAWRLFRPRRPIPVSGTPLYQAWKSDLDELADLAVLTADPAERGAARARRRRFSSEALARRLSTFGERRHS
jgi:hypothetical protein